MKVASTWWNSPRNWLRCTENYSQVAQSLAAENRALCARQALLKYERGIAHWGFSLHRKAQCKLFLLPETAKTKVQDLSILARRIPIQCVKEKNKQLAAHT